MDQSDNRETGSTKDQTDSLKEIVGTAAPSDLPKGNPKDESDKAKAGDGDPNDIVEKIRFLWAFIRRPENASGLIAIFTIVIAVATLIYVAVSIFQWREMSKTTKATQEAAYVACVNAQIARHTLIEMQGGGIDTHNLALSSTAQAAAATRAEAAQMEIERDNSFTMKVGTEIILPFLVKNIGKTAAIRPKIASVTEIYDAGREPVFSYPEKPKNHADTGFMFPDDKPMVFQSAIWKSDKKMVLDKASSDKLLRKDTYLITWGSITYDDVFGQSHWVDFCIWETLPGDSSIQNHPKCAAYNQIDASMSVKPPENVRSPEMPEITCQKPN